MEQKVKIKFESFSFKYKTLKNPTLKNINLEIYEGEKILIAGRSGSGKSTIIHCINGIIPFSMEGEVSGTLSVDGVEPYKSSIFEVSKKVGTILQDQDAQFIGLSVGEDTAFSMENDATSQEMMKGIVEKSLKIVEMEDFISYSPYELSGGQKQRVSIAGVLSSTPEIFVFDEPLANLDPQSGKNVVNLINELSKTTKKTIIIVEHRIEEILEANPDRIVIIEEGEIVLVDTPSNILISGKLKEAGIREPLFIEAVRNTNIDLSQIENVHKVESFAKLSVREKVLGDIAHIAKRIEQDKKVILSVQDLSHQFTKDKQVLKNISFNINQGEIVSILGNNGAGKSTLSFLIAGFLPCKHGKIFLSGEDITSSSIVLRGEKIGLVMQNPNTMIVKNIVFDEVSLGLKARRFDNSYIMQKTEEVLKTCGLWGYRHWPISALSYGQKKRVTIASILVLEPKIIILDEPTAGQDLKTYRIFMDFISALSKNGIAIILITHDMQLSLEYSTRSIIIAKGEKIADDKVASVFSRKEILAAANLRETSLYSLAEALKIDKQMFIEFFLSKHKTGSVLL